MQITQNIIDEVNQRADIVDVVGKHLKLKRSGQNYFACCPFHNEKSPSFSVNSVKQIYHCFGCGESGNSISFVMKYLGLDFISAVKSLAEQYGVYIPEDNNQPKISKEEIVKQKQRKIDIHQTMQKALQFYRTQLANSSYAQHYLANRGLSNEIINKFELGFAPNNYQNMAQVFDDYARNKFLLDGGLVVDGEMGRRYDRFRERVIFPIKNIKGDIIGFGGRILAKGEPKYLNSPETELFNKSQELYGLFEAKKSIRELNQVIVVEGYMDVIALNQYGITNVVATMGTAATEEHIKQLFRFCDNICYSFDGDNAGKKAAWRALERSVNLVTDTKAVSFLFLPSDHDPDSYIRELGVASFKEQVRGHSIGLITYLLNQLVAEVNVNTDEGKARLISVVKPYLEQIKASALQVILKKQLANIVDLEPNVIESILNNRTKFAFYNRKANNINNAMSQYGKRSEININLLKSIVMALFNNPHLAREFPVPSLEKLNSLDTDVAELFRLIDYLELNCDEFANIELSELAAIVNFQHINMANIYHEVKLERSNYGDKAFFNTSDEYKERMNKLVYVKKRSLPPKLN